jgi:hypothetical protein
MREPGWSFFHFHFFMSSDLLYEFSRHFVN